MIEGIDKNTKFVCSKTGNIYKALFIEHTPELRWYLMLKLEGENWVPKTLSKNDLKYLTKASV